jgi:hypothetical protein
MIWRPSAGVVTGFMILVACARPPAQPVEDLGGGQDVSRIALTSLKGTRDGDRLDVQAVYSDSLRQITVLLHFQVTPPSHLTSGVWKGLTREGTVRERSLTFLGGQSGPPSVGGRFDLVAPDGQLLYRVSIPLQELKERL